MNFESFSFSKNNGDNKTEVFDSLTLKNQEAILKDFSPEEQIEIKNKQRILSSLAFFIGKDFKIPVELNQVGKGWHWDFKNNIIRIDPKDLLEKDMDYLRFVISHEAGHRRISRADFIPTKEWQEPGFSFLMNAIEDPRDNNFVAENYPNFKEQVIKAYQQDFDLENKLKAKAETKLGYQPKFMQAGLEYIKCWHNWLQDEEMKVDESLPEDVQSVVENTLTSAEDSWSRYPSRQEVDDKIKGEQNIKNYAKFSYRINRQEIWPEFKKLVEQDKQNQAMQEFMKDMQSEQNDFSVDEDLQDKLTKEEKKELSKAIKEAMENSSRQENDQNENSENNTEQGQTEQEADDQNENSENNTEQGQTEQEAGDQNENSENNPEQNQTSSEDNSQLSEQIEDNNSEQTTNPVDLDSLSEGLKQKIKDYIDSLPEEQKQKLQAKAEQTIKDFEEEVNEELEAKLNERVDEQINNDDPDGLPEKLEQSELDKDFNKAKIDKHLLDKVDEFKDVIEKSLAKNENDYTKKRAEVLPIINKLEDDLREIFVERKAHKIKTGFKSGNQINIPKRMQEQAQGISSIESKAWQRREKPDNKDYSISLLVDLSGSMQGKKIRETFKAVIVLTEVLNKLSINFEVLGFNDKLYEYKDFNKDLSADIRENLVNMLDEVDGSGASYNDDGWALSMASKRLSKQKTKENFLIVLSDGLPEESSQHKSYDLDQIVAEIRKNTDQNLIGLGIGSGTGHVKNYYPNSVADINVQEMGTTLAKVIERAITDYDKFN